MSRDAYKDKYKMLKYLVKLRHHGGTSAGSPTPVIGRCVSIPDMGRKDLEFTAVGGLKSFKGKDASALQIVYPVDFVITEIDTRSRNVTLSFSDPHTRTQYYTGGVPFNMLSEPTHDKQEHQVKNGMIVDSISRRPLRVNDRAVFIHSNFDRVTFRNGSIEKTVTADNLAQFEMDSDLRVTNIDGHDITVTRSDGFKAVVPSSTIYRISN